MGHAIRTNMPTGLRLATSGMTVHTRPVLDVSGSAYATARVSWVDVERRMATATVQIYGESDELLAVGSGSFSALPAPKGRILRDIDWSRLQQGAVSELRLEELDDGERRIWEAVVRRATDSADLQETVLGVDWQTVSPERSEGRALVGAHLENRAGHLQGGAAYGMIALAAQRAVSTETRVAEVRVQFLRPGRRGTVWIHARVLRRGRTLAFIHAVVEQDGAQIADGMVTLVTM